MTTGELVNIETKTIYKKHQDRPQSGDCTLWFQFLDKVTGGDLELQRYLQRVAGYCLTGITSEHVLFFLYGTGPTGKLPYQYLLELAIMRKSRRWKPSPRTKMTATLPNWQRCVGHVWS